MSEAVKRRGRALNACRPATEPVWETTHCRTPTPGRPGETRALEAVKGLSGVEGAGEGWVLRTQRTFREWNYSVWYYNGGHTALSLFLNPQNVNRQQWTPREPRLWVMTCHHQWSQGGCAWGGCRWETSVFSLPFCCAPKRALNNHVF